MRDSENVIEVTDVTKKFKVYYDKGKTLKEKALRANRNKYEEREVLKGISFCVKSCLPALCTQMQALWN